MQEDEQAIELPEMCNTSHDGLLSPEALPPMESTTIMVSHSAKNTSSDEDISVATRIEGLPVPLRFLFALNGFSLAFPLTALLYVVNTKVEMSLTLLPTYGAIAFLPNSLRPLYAYLSHTPFRDYQFSILLMASALSIAVTTLIPKHGIVLCFLVAFFRGVTSSWPEFLLGLTLVDLARLRRDDFDKTCAIFQAQAATSRNIGSFLASVGALWIVARNETLEASAMNILLMVAAAANVVGAGIALYYKVGRQPESQSLAHAAHPPNYQSVSTQDVETGPAASNPSVLRCNSTTGHNLRLVVLLQITVVLIALKQPIEEALSLPGWQGLTFTSTLALALALVAAVWTGHWGQPQKVGLFLILRHVTPSVGYLLSSYLYDIFSSAPYLLQLLSLADMVTSTGAAWTYGKFWSKFSSDAALPRLIVGLTLLASILSLMRVWLVHILPQLDETPLVQFGLVLAVSGIVNWAGIWNFMPDVVLATTSVKYANKGSVAATVTATNQDGQDSFGSETINEDNINEESTQERLTRNMQYGTLISCIDFGDQLGALVLGAMVAALDVSRENSWAHLDDLIQLCGILGACSAVFIFILK